MKSLSLTFTFLTTELTLFAGVGPLAIIPWAGGHGRRPVYLVGNLVAAITNIIAGYCDPWVGIMVTRALNGLAAGSVVAVGAATICHLYFIHQRGVYMGIYTVCLTNGSQVRNSPTYPNLILINISRPLDCSNCWRICCRVIRLACLFLYSRLCPAWDIHYHDILPSRDAIFPEIRTRLSSRTILCRKSHISA